MEDPYIDAPMEDPYMTFYRDPYIPLMHQPYIIAAPYGSLGLLQVPKSLLYKPFLVV